MHACAAKVLESPSSYNDLLNVLAALQNILDPAHFKGVQGPLKKVGERLVACGFEDTIAAFMDGLKKRYKAME